MPVVELCMGEKAVAESVGEQYDAPHSHVLSARIRLDCASSKAALVPPSRHARLRPHVPRIDIGVLARRGDGRSIARPCDARYLSARHPQLT